MKIAKLKTENYSLGLTIIEMLVIVGVFGVIVAVTLPQFAKLKENQVTKNAVADAISSINKARSRTLSSFDSSTYGVRFETDKVVIFKGTVYSAGAADNEVVSIISPASITNVTLAGVSGSAGEMYFNRLTGAPSKTGTITIFSPTATKTITISATGSASSN